MARRFRVTRKLLMAAAAAVFAVLLAELGALAWLHWLASDADFRLYASAGELRSRYGVSARFAVHRHLGFALAPGYERGPNRHNRLGFRGEDFALLKPEGTVRIVCCGGSTTYGEGVVDYRVSMPFLLELGLRAAGHEVEVINAGCPGWTSLETLINFQTRLLELDPDYVVFCHGINDVFPRLVWPATAYRGDWSGWLSRDDYRARVGLFEQSALARILMVRHGSIEPHSSMLRIIGDVPPTSHVFEFRQQRLDGTYPATVFQETPIERMLAANAPTFFERNLRSLLAVASEHGVRVVLCSFAYSRQFPNRAYIGHEAVRSAIDGTNAIVREVGRETGTPVVDLAREVTRKELFTDGEHYTRTGNIARAQHLFAFLLPRLKN